MVKTNLQQISPTISIKIKNNYNNFFVEIKKGIKTTISAAYGFATNITNHLNRNQKQLQQKKS